MIEMMSSAVAFEALGHESRLAIIRRLIPAGPRGVHAGAIAKALNLPPTRLSFHLNRLVMAGLIESRREGRRLYYAVQYPVLGGVVRFLIDDCCGAAPEGCLPDCPGLPVSMTGGCAPTGGRRRKRRKEEHDEGA
jgi:DNA-binding transcriptional ArsR family regulator